MSRINIITILLLIGMAAGAQIPGDTPEVSSNSFVKTYQRTNPALNYSYDQAKQIHNYSGNWDLDGDKKNDSVFFIGDGGAHLYFHLKVILSSDKKVRDFPFLVSDFPLLHPKDSLNKKPTENLPFPKLVVADFNDDGKDDIYMNMGPRDGEVPAKWKKKGVNSRHLVVTYESKDLTIKNYADVVARKKH